MKKSREKLASKRIKGAPMNFAQIEKDSGNTYKKGSGSHGAASNGDVD